MPPERDLSGEWLDAATGLAAAHIRGLHLRLPGYGDAGPTLEIFQYDEMLDAPFTAPNRRGLAHLAFAVEDVNAARSLVIKSGGSSLGEVVARSIPGAGHLIFCYCADPEGNMLELQHWSSQRDSSG